jgi:hypothetical protein
LISCISDTTAASGSDSFSTNDCSAVVRTAAEIVDVASTRWLDIRLDLWKGISVPSRVYEDSLSAHRATFPSSTHPPSVDRAPSTVCRASLQASTISCRLSILSTCSTSLAFDPAGFGLQRGIQGRITSVRVVLGMKPRRRCVKTPLDGTQFWSPG